MDARTRGQQMRVIRIEEIEVPGLGRHEMNGVQGPKEYRAIQPRDQGSNLLEQRECRSMSVQSPRVTSW